MWEAARISLTLTIVEKADERKAGSQSELEWGETAGCTSGKRLAGEMGDSVKGFFAIWGEIAS